MRVLTLAPQKWLEASSGLQEQSEKVELPAAYSRQAQQPMAKPDSDLPVWPALQLKPAARLPEA